MKLPPCLMADVDLFRPILWQARASWSAGPSTLETTRPVSGFPLTYEPVRYRRFELRSQPSGVGFNVARALTVWDGRFMNTHLKG